MDAVTGQPGPVPPDHSMGMVLKRAEQNLLRAKSAAIKPSGLTLSQYVALAELDKRPGVTAANLARACLVTPQAMAVALAPMHEQGLIDKSPHPPHNVLEVNLTDSGRHALQAAREQAEPVDQLVVDEFSADELTSLHSLLIRLAQATETPRPSPSRRLIG